jgi:hypothetical protein
LLPKTNNFFIIITINNKKVTNMSVHPSSLKDFTVSVTVRPDELQGANRFLGRFRSQNGIAQQDLTIFPVSGDKAAIRINLGTVRNLNPMDAAYLQSRLGRMRFDGEVPVSGLSCTGPQKEFISLNADGCGAFSQWVSQVKKTIQGTVGGKYRDLALSCGIGRIKGGRAVPLRDEMLRQCPCPQRIHCMGLKLIEKEACPPSPTVDRDPPGAPSKANYPWKGYMMLKLPDDGHTAQELVDTAKNCARAWQKFAGQGLTAQERADKRFCIQTRDHHLTLASFYAPTAEAVQQIYDRIKQDLGRFAQKTLMVQREESPRIFSSQSKGETAKDFVVFPVRILPGSDFDTFDRLNAVVDRAIESCGGVSASRQDRLPHATVGRITPPGSNDFVASVGAARPITMRISDCVVSADPSNRYNQTPPAKIPVPNGNTIFGLDPAGPRALSPQRFAGYAPAAAADARQGPYAEIADAPARKRQRLHSDDRICPIPERVLERVRTEAPRLYEFLTEEGFVYRLGDGDLGFGRLFEGGVDVDFRDDKGSQFLAQMLRKHGDLSFIELRIGSCFCGSKISFSLRPQDVIRALRESKEYSEEGDTSSALTAASLVREILAYVLANKRLANTGMSMARQPTFDQAPAAADSSAPMVKRQKPLEKEELATYRTLLDIFIREGRPSNDPERILVQNKIIQLS